METLEWVNRQLEFYRNHESKWVRELTSLYEQYFDKEFRTFLTDDKFEENEIREIFLFSLDTLYIIIRQDTNYTISTQVENPTGNEMSLGEYFFYALAHSSNKDNSINKEKVQTLFVTVTLPFRIFFIHNSRQQIEYFNTKNNREQLKNRVTLLEGELKAYQKVLEDKQEEQRKKIENMAQSYIEACEKFRKFNPSNLQLSEISGLTERLWREQKRNKYFLKYLMSEIQKKYNLTNKKNEVGREFWKKAIDYINTKIQFISDPDGFKFKLHQIIELKDQTQIDNRFAKSKSKKIKGIQSQNKDMGSVEDEVAECFVCGEPIESGNLCNDCEKDFPIKRE